MKAGESDELELLGSCQRCGGRAALPPFCLTCMHEWYDEQIKLIRCSVELRSPWFGRDMLVMFKAIKAQLPTGPDRMGFWRSRGGQMRG